MPTQQLTDGSDLSILDLLRQRSERTITSADFGDVPLIIEALRELPGKFAAAKAARERWLTIFEIGCDLQVVDWSADQVDDNPLVSNVVARTLWHYCLAIGLNVNTGVVDFFPRGKAPYSVWRLQAKLDSSTAGE